ncbi:MAG: flagellar basal body-associated FliL family protein [Myxococcales bacterium]|nr:flagellar basal body-associated FliL family protein [Myxococcales bacterium]
MLAALLPAVLAGGAAFGGARFGGAHGDTPAAAASEPGPTAEPGPTVALQPFVLNLTDSSEQQHALRITLAVELERGGNAEEFNVFVPRVRDAALSYLRTLDVAQVTAATFQDDLRSVLLERIHGLGAAHADRILITDLVMQ